jgi:hypothetical protein
MKFDNKMQNWENVKFVFSTWQIKLSPHSLPSKWNVLKSYHLLVTF